MIGFSTACTLPFNCEESFHNVKILNENKMDLAFRAVIESEEEAVLNSMVAADTVIGYKGEVRLGLLPYLERYLDLIK